MACLSCNIELCYSCENPDEETMDCCCGGKFFMAGAFMLPEKSTSLGRPRMNPEDMTDALRAGRNRAGRQIKIEPGKICEWANLKAAGGGIRPIIGCLGNDANARHHGPDKSTINNELGVNLHIICHTCHNRWHALNDKYYDARPLDGSIFVPRADAGTNHPHDSSTLASDQEKFDNEIFWATPAAKREVEETEIEDVEEENSSLTEDLSYDTMDEENADSGELDDFDEKDFV